MTLAHLLHLNGFQITLVEIARGVRPGGNPVDVRGPAAEVAQRLGILSALQAAATRVTTFAFVDKRGKVVAERRGFSNTSSDDIEIPPGDLARILYESLPTGVETIFGHRVVALRQETRGVTVFLNNDRTLTCDLVVGADGLHSGIRRLVFGPEAQYVRHLGLYIATVKAGIPADSDHVIHVYNEPGKAAILHPSRGDAVGMLLFRAQKRIDYGDRDALRQFLRETYQNMGWQAQNLLRAYDAADDTYFDTVSSVRIDCWSRGRVTLLGDAASCVSLFGEGTSSAIAGAATLAEELTRSPRDVQRAIAAYEARHRPLIMPRQRGMRTTGAFIVPSTQMGIICRNLALRVLDRLA
jgi:2-polyprenyl-6-methoxyphenol hydroxylase-like FAD-dependent oxidoreductase